VVNNGNDFGLIKFTVTQVDPIPLTIYYNCEYHPAMEGKILIQAPTEAPIQVPTASPIAPLQTFNVTHFKAQHYIINDQINPELRLLKPGTYKFIVNANGHPFWIKTARGTIV
jgi:hypothetical protein